MIVSRKFALHHHSYKLTWLMTPLELDCGSPKTTNSLGDSLLPLGAGGKKLPLRPEARLGKATSSCRLANLQRESERVFFEMANRELKY